jgi:DNA topoisomerase-1
LTKLFSVSITVIRALLHNKEISMAKKDDAALKTLIIVESPTKARTIKRFLGSEYTVVACNGHVRDLPSKELSIDVEGGYVPKYVISKGKDKIIKDIKSELAKSSLLLLATDEDREGESIAWHLLEILKPKIPYRRMVFHEITKRSILHALEHGRPLDMDLVNAQEARRILDRLYGYTLSPFLWRKLSHQKLSAGRVQSPGLRMVVERERQRMSFVSASYWDLKANLCLDKECFEAKLEEVDGLRVATGKDFSGETGQLKKPKQTLLLNEEEAIELVKKLESVSWKVVSVEEKERKNRPSPPFITSTLQQEGSRKLRLSAKETMRIAQKLYESGLITYMRTDSPSLSQEGIQAAREAVTSLYGNEYLNPTSRQYSAKSSAAQEAHEAIRPAGFPFIHPDATKLQGVEKSLYELIWKRTLASQMADAIKASTSVKIEADNTIFNATGNRIVFAGFIRVYVEGKDDPELALEDSETFLPPLKESDLLALKQLDPVGHETKAPARFTEATLVQQLEKEGIGRPSTYATIIDRLFEKEYVLKENSALVPTFIAFAVIQLLENNFKELVEYEFTSKMEDQLDEIAVGNTNQNEFLQLFYEGENGLNNLVDDKMTTVKAADAKKIALNTITKPYQVMIGKFGPYVTKEENDQALTATIPTSLFPGTVTNVDLEKLLESKTNGNGEPQSIGIDEKTQMPIYLLSGRYGPYYQLGLKSDENPKPKRATVPKGLNSEELEISTVSKLLHLPRKLGTHPSTNKEVFASLGPYGPYVGSNGVFVSLKDLDKIFSIELEEAVALIDAPKEKKGSKRAGSTPIKSFGQHEDKPLDLYNGRYGYYAKWGTKNIALPKEMKKDEKELEKLTKEMLITLIEEAKKKS